MSRRDGVDKRIVGGDIEEAERIEGAENGECEFKFEAWVINVIVSLIKENC